MLFAPGHARSLTWALGRIRRECRTAMELVGPDGSLRLTVTGYQYPGAAEWWDANWLQVRAAVRHPRGAWEATAPCVLTTDLPEIADWLEALAVGRPAAPNLEFIEPNLRF